LGGYDDRSEKPERPEKPERQEKKEKPEAPENSTQPGNGGYRYKTPAQKNHPDTPVPKSSTMLITPDPSPFVLLSSLFSIENTLVG
jgi:hypothetical protein